MFVDKGNCEFTTAGAFLGVSTTYPATPAPAVDRWETRTDMDGVNDAAAPVLVSVGRFIVIFDRCRLGPELRGAVN